MFSYIANAVTGDGKANEGKTAKIEGTVVLMKKNFLDFNQLAASALDKLRELAGHRIAFQLISGDHGEPGTVQNHILRLFSSIFVGRAGAMMHTQGTS